MDRVFDLSEWSSMLERVLRRISSSQKKSENSGLLLVSEPRKDSREDSRRRRLQEYRLYQISERGTISNIKKYTFLIRLPIVRTKKNRFPFLFSSIRLIHIPTGIFNLRQSCQSIPVEGARNVLNILRFPILI